MFFQSDLKNFLLAIWWCSRYVKGVFNLVLCARKKVDPPNPSGGGQQLQRNFKLILRELIHGIINLSYLHIDVCKQSWQCFLHKIDFDQFWLILNWFLLILVNFELIFGQLFQLFFFWIVMIFPIIFLSIIFLITDFGHSVINNCPKLILVDFLNGFLSFFVNFYQCFYCHDWLQSSVFSEPERKG